ncbi:Mitochondrial/chloroplast ribosomal protein L6 [Ceraceosorus bombacis]|uniref:Mitochondrial/chloroplast ribosomal protein L6 n=1 Tax=Ceraceosorus bombacis TaxID=401625 RepID=A0A0P1BNV7_9BASI|nr:Mitochondrial/chloroplast ribosomal protein L6 [Ceraceosorus bombacis]
MSDTKEVRAAWGTTAAKLLNAIQGVTESHKFQLDLVGVGYRAALEEDPFPRLDDVELALQAIEEGSASKVKTHFTSSAQNQFYASHVQQWKEAQSTGTELDAHVKKNSDGKRARLRLHLRLGYSHPVLIPVPRGVTVAVPSPTVIKLWGADKEDLGLFAASIRMWRRPEPYKGKGIYVNGEKIQLRTAKKK